jgi:UDP-N-acetyl-D-mannosaminuronate dehydrogenase
MRIGILGHGEVGQAIEEAYFKHSACVPLIRDLNRNDGLHDLNVLNICLPYTENFIKYSLSQIEESSPELTIIHSTIKPGTTALLKEVSERCIVHSPIRGAHPNLYEGLMTFDKFIGAETTEDAQRAALHFDRLLISWHGEMKEMCDKHGVNFEEAVTDFNNSYNTGYQKLNQFNVVRPTLYPPGSKIGGHCILQNLEILKDFHSSEAFSLIDKYKGE